jgi:hypothetical protein
VDAMSNPNEPSDAVYPGADRLRDQAIKRLREKRGLMAHTLAYVTVNALLVAIWMSTGRSFFWPVFAIFGWGIGLAFHAWNVYWPEPDERRIAREIERLRRADATHRP